MSKPHARLATITLAIVSLLWSCGGRATIDCDGDTEEDCLSQIGCVWNYATPFGCFTPCEDDDDCGSPNVCGTEGLQTHAQEPAIGAIDVCTFAMGEALP